MSDDVMPARYVEIRDVGEDGTRTLMWKHRIPDRIADEHRLVWDEAFLWGWVAHGQYETDGRIAQVWEQ